MEEEAKEGERMVRRGTGLAAGYAGRGRGMGGGLLGESTLFARDMGAAMATGGEVGELFQYAIDQPVSIGRKSSAMIPIVNAPTEGEKVSVYNAAVDAKHPMNGVKLKNTTGLHLMPGAVTVFDGGVYGGDALIESLSADDERLITYAMDLDVEVEQTSELRPEELVSVKIAKGTVLVTHKQRRETKYTAKSVAATEKTLLVEHPYQPDWKLLEPEKFDERTQTLYRFRVALGPKATEKLSIVEEHPVSQTVAILPASPDEVALILHADGLSDEVRTALQKVVQMKTDVADIEGQIAEREGRLKEIGQEQERIRQNMEQLDRDSELYKRYVEKFTDQEDEYEKLQTEIKDLKTKRDDLNKQLQDYVMGLEIG